MVYGIHNELVTVAFVSQPTSLGGPHIVVTSFMNFQTQLLFSGSMRYLPFTTQNDRKNMRGWVSKMRHGSGYHQAVELELDDSRAHSWGYPTIWYNGSDGPQIDIFDSICLALFICSQFASSICCEALTSSILVDFSTWLSNIFTQTFQRIEWTQS